MKSHSIESSFCFNLTVVSNVFVFTLLASTLTHVQNIALSHFLSRLLVSVCIPSSLVKLCSNGCQAMDLFQCSPGSLCLQCLTFLQLSLLVDTLPQWYPEPSAPPGRYPGGQGRGNHGPSGWSRTPSCGAPRSRWPCLTRQSCWTCPQRRWAGDPMLPEGASEPEPQERKSYSFITKFGVKWWKLQTTQHVGQQREILVYLASLFAVREVTVSGEPTGSEGFAWIWVLWALNHQK